MTTHRLGIGQTDWEAMRDALLEAKRADSIHVGVTHGASDEMTVDTSDVSLDVHLHVIHLDVSQGEATLVLLLCEVALCRALGLSPCLLSVLIDGGLKSDGGGLIARTMRLWNIRDLDAAIVSHFDGDHTEGVTRLIAEISLTAVATEAVDAAKKELASADASLEAASATPYVYRGPKQIPNPELTKANRRVTAATRTLSDAQAWLDRLVRDADEEATEPATADTPGWTTVQVQNVFLRIEPGDLGDAAHAKQTLVVKALAHALGRSSAQAHAVEAGDSLVLDCDADSGMFELTCLTVNQGDDGGKDPENAHSIAWLLKFGKYRYYTAGDLPSSVEDGLALAAHAPLTAIKCGHHGSESSTSAAFLATTQPRLAFLSSGKQDGFGHPHTRTLLRLWKAPGMEAVFATNCFYNRPFYTRDYLSLAAEEVHVALSEALTELEGWNVPALDADEQSMRTGEQGIIEQIASLKVAHASLLATWTKLRDDIRANGVACSDGDLQAAVELPTALKKWSEKNQEAIFALAKGFRTDRRTVQANFRPDSQTYGIARPAVARAAATASQLLEARKAFAKAPASPPKMYLTSSEAALGTVTLAMSLHDANCDDRTCWVGYENLNGWLPFRIAPLDDAPDGDVDAYMPNEEFLQVMELEALRQMAVPGSPQHYSTYLDERVEPQRSRKRKYGDPLENPAKRRRLDLELVEMGDDGVRGDPGSEDATMVFLDLENGEDGDAADLRADHS